MARHTGRRRLTLTDLRRFATLAQHIVDHHRLHPNDADLALCIVSYMSTAAREAAAPDGVAFGLDVSDFGAWFELGSCMNTDHDRSR